MNGKPVSLGKGNDLVGLHVGRETWQGERRHAHES
jgi:hypothetical protein